jgi:hypothetical protein
VSVWIDGWWRGIIGVSPNVYVRDAPADLSLVDLATFDGFVALETGHKLAGEGDLGRGSEGKEGACEIHDSGEY